MTWTVAENTWAETEGDWQVRDEKQEVIVSVNSEQLARKLALLPEFIEIAKGCLTGSARRMRVKLAEIEAAYEAAG